MPVQRSTKVRREWGDEPLSVLTFPEGRRTSKKEVGFPVLHLDAGGNMVVATMQTVI